MSYRWTTINNEVFVLVKNKVLDVSIQRRRTFFIWHIKVLVIWSYKTTGDVTNLDNGYTVWETLDPKNERECKKVNDYLTENHLDKFFDDLENTSLLKRIYKDLIFKTTGIKIVEFKAKTTNSINTIIKEIDRMCKLLTVIK